MSALKLRKIGNSVGVVLPKEVLARLRVSEGDKLFLHDTPDGIALSPRDANFEEQMKVAREVMRERRAVLRELAK
ncbi:MAG: AbrB/MazE/SpoVT family DNA-binding domain-containing protein [Bosea sp. (in: a-proteobacteria)]